MNSSLSLSSPIELPAEALALIKTARRVETPCGAASLVWHIWGEASCVKGRPPVVLFHGGSGSWTHWLLNIAALVESGRCVYVPDLPGFGDSAAPLEGTDADVCFDPVEAGLKLLLGETPCELVGFSFGGMVAGFLTAQYPARVSRLVLVGAPGFGISNERALRLNAWRHLTDLKQRDDIHRKNLAALMLYRPEAITELALRVHVANVLRDRMQGRSLSRTDVLARSLVNVTCPIDAIYGAEDALYKGNMPALETALRQVPQLKTLTFIKGAGHWIQFENAEAFNAALLDVLSA